MFDRERARPSLYTIPGGAPFLDVLVENILGGEFAPRPGACDPLDLARYTVLLPTRRACRALSERFLSVSGGDALLLPRIRPIVETDENEGLLQGLSAERHGAGGFHVAPSVSELERRLVLSQLVLKWSEAQTARATEGGPLSLPVGSVRSPAQAVHLGIELANLMDLVETEEGDFSRLDNLVPEAYSEHWQVTLDFLKIVTEFWPNYLDERHFLSPAERRSRLLAAEAERLKRTPPDAPYIIAGVTGSVPATARLMTTVAGLANCAVVLPGLDCALDEATWQTLAQEHPEHPQHGLAKLLRSLGVERAEVKPLGGMHEGAAGTRRMALVTEAMRPAPTTGLWHTIGDRIEKATTDVALEGLTLVEADTSDEEARVVALILRGAVEDSKRSAALVTSDRNLARRVAVKLEAWGLRIDDSAGRPLEKTVPGAFLDLILDV
ncbi:MAG: double-strand break repair protein AddB, partial [Hyphomicrobiaceae bacterium]